MDSSYVLDYPLPIYLHHPLEAIKMAYEIDPKEVVDFRELVMTNTIQVDTMYRLLIEKGYFTEAEFLNKMQEVQTLFMKGKNQPITK
jgi:hypothetical protein